MNRKIVKLFLILTLFAIAGTAYCCSHAGGGSVKVADKDIPSAEAAFEEKGDAEEKQDTVSDDGIWVYVSGQVAFPGVYYLEADARVYEAVEMAGGFTADAAEDAMNLAAVLTDGQHLLIPDMDSVDNEILNKGNGGELQQGDGLININTASAEELKSLPGIGDAKAAAIISYRQKNRFVSIEDIMNVPGIKENLFNNIKELITV